MRKKWVPRVTLASLALFWCWFMWNYAGDAVRSTIHVVSTK